MAGEIGHVTIDPRGELCGCGNHGCMETVATDVALCRAVSRRYGTSLDVDEVVRLVRSGEIHPDEEIRATIEYLYIAISMVINIFNPSSVFVRGKMLGAQENLFQQLLHLVRQRTLAAPLADCRVHHASVTKLQGAVAGIVMHLANALAPTFS